MNARRTERKREKKETPKVVNTQKKKKNGVKPEGDFVTTEDVGKIVEAAVGPILKRIDHVLQAQGQRNDAVKGGSAKRTKAEIMEINEQFLNDAQTINARNRVGARVFPKHIKTLKGSYLQENLRPNTDKKTAMKVVNDVIRNETDSEVMKEFQQRMDKMKIRCGLLATRNKAGGSILRPSETDAWEDHKNFLDKSGITKILTNVNITTDFVPEGWSTELLQYYYEKLEVGGSFMSFPMPRSPYTRPIMGRPTAKRRTTPTASTRGGNNEKTASDPANNIVTFEAEKMAVRIDLHDDFVEDTDDLDDVIDDLMMIHIPEAMVGS